MNLGFKIRGLTTFMLVILGIYILYLVQEEVNQRDEFILEEDKNDQSRHSWMSLTDANLIFTCENITDINVIMFLAGGSWMNTYLGIYKNFKVFVLRTIRNDKVFLTYFSQYD